MTGRLEHPGVVPVYGLGTDDQGHTCYAMRLIRGQTLQDAIHAFHAAGGPKGDSGGKAPDLRGLLRRFISVCNTVAYAHSRGVIHRDLKPKNVMIGPFDETLVVDWGLTKPFEHGEAAGVGEDRRWPVLANGDIPHTVGPVGTLGYMSPEQAREEPVGPASDIYSLGATLYSILTGHAPISGENPIEVLERIRRNEYPPARSVNPGVHPALDAACTKAMATRPEDRYPHPLALAADIDRWLADEPVSSWREPISELARRWARRHRTLVTASAVALVMATAGLSAVLAAQSRANQRLRFSRDGEREARQFADIQTGLAMDAVRDYHIGVSQDALLKQPTLTELRTRLLRTPHQFYARLIGTLENGRRDDPVTLARLAAACFELGKLTAEIGSRDDAIASHRQALEIRKSLANDHPEVAEYRSALAESYHSLGTLYMSVGSAEQAESALKEAGQLFKALARDYPGVARYRAEQIKSQNNLGIVYYTSGRFDRAESDWAEARDVLRVLARDYLDSPEHRSLLGKVETNLGSLYSATGRDQLAEAAYGGAVAILSPLVLGHPDIVDYRVDLAMARNNLAMLDYESGRSIAPRSATGTRWRTAKPWCVTFRPS